MIRLNLFHISYINIYLYNFKHNHCCLQSGFSALVALPLVFPFESDFSFSLDFFFFLVSFYYSSSSSSSIPYSQSPQPQSPSCQIPRQYQRLYGRIQSTIMPPISKSLSRAYLFFSYYQLCYTVATAGASRFLKKLKNDFASTCLVTTLCCPVFLFFCFFFTYLTVKFFPFHSMIVASVFTASSFFKKNFLVSCLLLISSLSAKSKTIVKLSVPYQSITWIFSMAFRSGSSYGPTCYLTKFELVNTLYQQSGSFLAPRFYLTLPISYSVKYLFRSFNSAQAISFLP